MTISKYLENLNERYQTGISREHSYRSDLQVLLESLLDNILVTNEAARIECGAPDYILTRKGIPVGYIEAKDIGEPLKGDKHKEQFDRYKEYLPNLIFTDYLEFHLYRNGDFASSIRIADLEDGTIVPKSDKFDQFNDLINEFASHTAQTITSSSKLSKMMAGKARLLSSIIENALKSDEEATQVNETANNTLREQLEAFKQVLIHDIDAKEFADIYAQTIAYGMFAARLHDPTLESFSRQEAAQLIPKTNPFLRKLFQYIAGYDLDERIDWVVDALADIFRATDVVVLLKDFGKATQQNDPIIHFYETFLAEFDPALRKSRGVWYTPEPVVNFIVRAVDDILKDEFDLSDGLADTAKTTVTVQTDVPDKRTSSGYKQEENEIHKVQILDPAAGTGTFLAEVIRQIHSKFEGQKGIWPSYVENHLIPRINGFEILMASYAMAHLKLDLLLREKGYNRESDQRFRVYLTNSLEEHHPDTGTLFASWLSEEANQANHVKRDTPVMVVMGNPPYSGISSNMGEWITNLIEDYKYVDGEHFGERKHWLHDDYVKFIRYGQHFVEKNGEGVLAYINNHSFIDNPTFKGMRWQLLKAFDEIYIIDLHGNAKKKEKAPDGSADQNIFDIQSGVSINLFIKGGSKNDLAEVFHYNIWGDRNDKFQKLLDKSISSIEFNKVKHSAPYYFFCPRDETWKKKYESGFGIDEIMNKNTVGFVSANDRLNISYSKDEHNNKIEDLFNLEESKWREKYKRPNDSRDWKYANAKEDALENHKDISFSEVSYRPFDKRTTLYTGNSRGLYASPQPKIMHHLLREDNLGLVVGRQGQVVGSMPWNLVFVTKQITDFNLFYRGGGMLFPLYLYPEGKNQHSIDDNPERISNLNKKIVGEIAEKLDLNFIPEKEDKKETFTPIDLLDYIYAILHSPTYREKYKEFLKIDFPRVPYPTNTEIFWELVKLGGELRKIHLLEHPIVNNFITTYPVEGDNEISNRLTKTDPGYFPYTEEDDAPRVSRDDSRYPGERLGKIQINDEQYFGHVPEKAWNFYIGGYQPAEKWLKDRRDRQLSFEEIRHYQKIIVALMETDRIMKEIDKIGFD